MIKSITAKTPDGEFHIIVDEGDTAIASGFGSLDELSKRLPKEFKDSELELTTNHLYETYVAEYYNGDKNALAKIPRRQSGSAFQEKVWQVINDIPFGHTISYKQLAEQSGNLAAIRAAGTICGLNKLILLVPCHRVLKSDGSIGSYLYGTKIKESLLNHEQHN